RYKASAVLIEDASYLFSLFSECGNRLEERTWVPAPRVNDSRMHNRKALAIQWLDGVKTVKILWIKTIIAQHGRLAGARFQRPACRAGHGNARRSAGNRGLR